MKKIEQKNRDRNVRAIKHLKNMPILISQIHNQSNGISNLEIFKKRKIEVFTSQRTPFYWFVIFSDFQQGWNKGVFWAIMNQPSAGQPFAHDLRCSGSWSPNWSPVLFRGHDRSFKITCSGIKKYSPVLIQPWISTARFVTLLVLTSQV